MSSQSSPKNTSEDPGQLSSVGVRPEEKSLSRPDQSLAEAAAAAGFNPDEYEVMDEVFQRAFVGQVDPLAQAITPEILAQGIALKKDQIASEERVQLASMDHEHRQDKAAYDHVKHEGDSNKWYFTIWLSIGVATLLIGCVIFLAFGKSELLVPILSHLGIFAAGIAGGYGYGRKKKPELGNTGDE